VLGGGVAEAEEQVGVAVGLDVRDAPDVAADPYPAADAVGGRAEAPPPARGIEGRPDRHAAGVGGDAPPALLAPPAVKLRARPPGPRAHRRARLAGAQTGQDLSTGEGQAAVLSCARRRPGEGRGAQARTSRIGSPPWAIGIGRPARSRTSVSGSMPRQW